MVRVECVNLFGDGNAYYKDTEAVLVASKEVQVNCQENEAYILAWKMKLGQSQHKCNKFSWSVNLALIQTN